MAVIKHRPQAFDRCVLHLVLPGNSSALEEVRQEFKAETGVVGPEAETLER